MLYPAHLSAMIPIPISARVSMTAAFTIFAKAVTRERRIPFDLALNPDPFYSESNIRYLEKKMQDYKSGKLRLAEHELIED